MIRNCFQILQDRHPEQKIYFSNIRYEEEAMRKYGMNSEVYTKTLVRTRSLLKQ